MDGTPRALGPIARETLHWVAQARRVTSEAAAADLVEEDALRRIELCAKAALDISNFGTLYARLPSGHIDHIGGDPHATSSDLQDERGAPGGVPQAPEGGDSQCCGLGGCAGCG